MLHRASHSGIEIALRNWAVKRLNSVDLFYFGGKTSIVDRPFERLKADSNAGLFGLGLLFDLGYARAGIGFAARVRVLLFVIRTMANSG